MRPGAPVFSWIARGDSAFTPGCSEDARDYLAFDQSPMGALTAGLGSAAYWLAREPIARGEAWGRHAFASSIGLWFVIDNVASVATGFPRDVVSNVVLVAPLVPLLWGRRAPAVDRGDADVQRGGLKPPG